jgi:hypothetical protein
MPHRSRWPHPRTAVGSRRGMPVTSPAGSKFLRKQTNSLRCGSRQVCAMYRLMQRSKKTPFYSITSSARSAGGMVRPRLGRLEHQLKVGRPLTKAASMSLALLALSNSNCWLIA